MVIVIVLVGKVEIYVMFPVEHLSVCVCGGGEQMPPPPKMDLWSQINIPCRNTDNEPFQR